MHELQSVIPRLSQGQPEQRRHVPDEHGHVNPVREGQHPLFQLHVRTPHNSHFIENHY